ncbi:MAG: multicopper oxidase domain-containing protein, partial [Jatrophihabitantaceae bacterium]
MSQPPEMPAGPAEPLPTGGTAAQDGNRFAIHVSRRTMIKSMLTAAAAGGVLTLTKYSGGSPKLQLDASTPPVKAYTLAGTDGWVSMPVGANPMPPYFPDSLAQANGNSTGNPREDLATTYAFGFRNVTQYSPATVTNANPYLVDNVKNHVQISAPLLYAQAGQDLRLTLFNLGMGNRPDLFDSHTIHFHGFANQIAYFDGVPDASLSVPPGQSLHYRYLPVDAGTYMYHCHVEDVE